MPHIGRVLMAINIIADSISGLGGLLGGLIGRHGSAAKKIDALLLEAQNAAAGGDWAGVVAISNTIMAVPDASTAIMSGARNLSRAANTAVVTFRDSAGLPPAQVALVTLAQQQQVMSEVNALSAQLHSEQSGIWGHLWHAHRLAVSGTSV